MAFVDPHDLRSQLTELLMENGAAVTKQGVEKLVEFIANRDIDIMDAFIEHVEKMKVNSQRQTASRG